MTKNIPQSDPGIQKEKPRHYKLGLLHQIIEEEDLTMAELLLYCKIWNLPKGCYASYAKIAEWVGVSKRTIASSIKNLHSKGLIEQIKGAWKPTVGGSVGEEERDLSTDAKNCILPMQKISQTDAKNCTHYYISNTNKKNTNKKATPVSLEDVKSIIPTNLSTPETVAKFWSWIEWRKTAHKKTFYSTKSFPRIFKRFASAKEFMAGMVFSMDEQEYKGIFPDPDYGGDKAKKGQAWKDDWTKLLELASKYSYDHKRLIPHAPPKIVEVLKKLPLRDIGMATDYTRKEVMFRFKEIWERL